MPKKDTPKKKKQNKILNTPMRSPIRRSNRRSPVHIKNNQNNDIESIDNSMHIDESSISFEKTPNQTNNSQSTAKYTHSDLLSHFSKLH